MSGYYGFSMSNNAIDAYNTGEKPFSKWTKADILSELGELSPKFKKTKLSALKKELLYVSSWHHTSKEFNRTDFYSIDVEKAAEMSKSEIAKLYIKTEREQPKAEIKKISYLVWGGSKKHPKSTRYEAECEIIGNWALTPHGKKSITANGFIMEV